MAGGFENSRKLDFRLLTVFPHPHPPVCTSCFHGCRVDTVRTRKICFFDASAACASSPRNQEQLHVCWTIRALPFICFVLFLLCFSFSFLSPMSVILPQKKTPPSPNNSSLIVSVQVSQEKHFTPNWLPSTSQSVLWPPPLSEEMTYMGNALVWLYFSNTYRLLYLFLECIKVILLGVLVTF